MEVKAVDRADVLAALKVWGFEDSAIFKKYGLKLSSDAQKLIEHFNALVNYGFDPVKLQRMAHLAPGMLCSHGSRTLNALANYEALGLAKPQVIRMASRGPSILTYRTDRILKTLETLETVGIDRGDALRMAVKEPGFICFKAERIAASITVVVECLNGVDLARKLLLAFPGAFNFKTDTLRERLEVASAVGFDPLTRPMCLMMSPRLVRGRHVFLKKRGACCDLVSLYCSNKNFEKRFGETRPQVVALDPGRANFHP